MRGERAQSPVSVVHTPSTGTYRAMDEAVALLSEDRARAAAFVESQLGPVEVLGSRGEQLLDTLELFLQHGQRVANASAISGLHRGTVHRHLREIESLLGCRIEAHSADLLLALRLRRVIGHGRRRPLRFDCY